MFATQRNGKRGRTSGKLIRSRERFNETSLCKLLVGQAGKNYVLHVGFQRHREARNVSICIPKKHDSLRGGTVKPIVCRIKTLTMKKMPRFCSPVQPSILVT